MKTEIFLKKNCIVKVYYLINFMIMKNLLILIISLLVCGQTMAQRMKFDVPVNITIEGSDTTKTMLFKLNSITDTTSEINFEHGTSIKYVSHCQYSVYLAQNSYYLILFIFPDNSQIELFVETSDKSTETIDIIVDKNALFTRNVLYNELTSSYYWKEEPRDKDFCVILNKFNW